MAAVGVIARGDEPAIRKAAADLESWAQERRHVVVYERLSAEALRRGQPGRPARELGECVDAVVVLGGDGTMLKAARLIEPPKPVLIGVNFGTLGFLTEISPPEMLAVLEDCLAGRGRVSRRCRLAVCLVRGGVSVFRTAAVNEAAVQRGAQGRLADFDLFIGGEAVTRLRADGIICATPTGSTAYSLAAGGSIVYPELTVMLVTPICAHSLTNRPLVLPLETEVELRVPEQPGELVAVVDGQEIVRLEAGDAVRISSSAEMVKVARSPGQSYFGVLRSKLHWGVVNQAPPERHGEEETKARPKSGG